MVREEHVRRVAARLGVELEDTEVTGVADAANDLAAQFNGLESQSPDHPSATEIEAGTDEYRAIRYRFELPETTGPLADLSIGLKENIAVSGVPMHCGSEALDFRPSYHATVVDRLHEAGADLVATTNMDEFAYFTTGETCAFGPTANPRVDERVPGGSSSGSGAAVAAGLVDAALGTDTGGSIRIPASFCGIVGLKPTHRAVPRFGFVDLAPSLDCIGPLAGDVETTARVFDAIAGPDPHDPSSLNASPEQPAATGAGEDPTDLRVGVVEPAMTDADDPVRDAVSAVVDGLTDRGIDVESLDLPDYRTATLAGLAIAGTEFADLLLAEGHAVGLGTGASEDWRQAVIEAVRSPALGENVHGPMLTNATLAEDGLGHYVAARTIGAHLTKAVDDALETYDALLTPTTPMTALPFGAIETPEEFARTVANTIPFNITGHPALSIPTDTGEGAPVGVQSVGRRFDERRLITLGAAIEDVAS